MSALLTIVTWWHFNSNEFLDHLLSLLIILSHRLLITKLDTILSTLQLYRFLPLLKVLEELLWQSIRPFRHLFLTFQMFRQVSEVLHLSFLF
jgi:hypothetical protein